MSNATSYHKKHLRTEFINAIVMLSEAKHPVTSIAGANPNRSTRVADSYSNEVLSRGSSWILRSTQNDIITKVLSQSYSVRHFRAEHPLINRTHLLPNSRPGKALCDESASTCSHCCAIVVAHFN